MDMDHDLCVRAWMPFATTGDCAVWTEPMPGFDFALKLRLDELSHLPRLLQVIVGFSCLYHSVSCAFYLPVIDNAIAPHHKADWWINDHRARQKLDWKAMG